MEWWLELYFVAAFATAWIKLSRKKKEPLIVEFVNSDRTKRRRRRTDEKAAHPGGLIRLATRGHEGGLGQQRCGRQWWRRRRRGRSLFVFGMNLSFFSTIQQQHVNAFGEVVCLRCRFVSLIREFSVAETAGNALMSDDR